MTADFGAMLARLLEHRALEAGDLAAAAGVPESDLRAALAGAEPSEAALRGLGPALGLHASDLFLIAGQPVPDDLAPAGRGGSVDSLVWTIVYVPPIGRRVRDMVLQASSEAAATPLPEDRRPPEYGRWSRPGFGALLLRLFGNRNMSVLDAVKVLLSVAGFGPWSAATLSLVGQGRKEVSGELLAACSVVLGIALGDLAALAGMATPEPGRRTAPTAAEAVAVIWAARGLTAERIEHIYEQSHRLRHEYDDVVREELLCHCPLFRRVPRSVPQ
jgi:hypothetical protein